MGGKSGKIAARNGKMDGKNGKVCGNGFAVLGEGGKRWGEVAPGACRHSAAWMSQYVVVQVRIHEAG
jgi:hypothetical protein